MRLSEFTARRMLALQAETNQLRKEVKRQKARADLWRHRAMNKKVA